MKSINIIIVIMIIVVLVSGWKRIRDNVIPRSGVNLVIRNFQSFKYFLLLSIKEEVKIIN